MMDVIATAQQRREDSLRQTRITREPPSPAENGSRSRRRIHLRNGRQRSTLVRGKA
jgi:hypothetical protein